MLTMSRRSSIPLLDMLLWESNRAQFVEELRSACHGVGFFLLQHNLPQQLVETQLRETKQFFDRSLDQKMQISYEEHSTFRGYMRMGVENTAGGTDCREQIELATEYSEQECAKLSSWPPYERLKGCNPWPASFQPTLQSTTQDYVERVESIAAKLVSALCMALQLSPDAAAQWFGLKPHWALKLVSYPPADTDAPFSFGVGSHTDTNFLTMIIQDGSPGLQVHSKGAWADVPSVSTDCFICNLGEQAEIMSCGYFCATPHRVLLAKETQRTSVPFFYNPSLSSIVTPLVTQEHLMELPWERSDDIPNWRRSENTLLSCVGENTFKSLARSHPMVFCRHHPDLKVLPTGQVVRREDTEERE